MKNVKVTKRNNFSAWPDRRDSTPHIGCGDHRGSRSTRHKCWPAGRVDFANSPQSDLVLMRQRGYEEDSSQSSCQYSRFQATQARITVFGEESSDIVFVTRQLAPPNDSDPPVEPGLRGRVEEKVLYFYIKKVIGCHGGITHQQYPCVSHS